MTKFWLLLVVAISTNIMETVPSSADSSESVDNAFYLCAAMDHTGMDSAPCDVDGWGSAVKVSIDTDADQARQLCAGVAQMMASKGKHFDPQWTLQIRSPYSGDNSIAYCSLTP